MTVERRLAFGLRLLCEGRRYRDLGYVRLGDYLTERLGMSLRRCQSLLRSDRVLSECPALARAFDAGDLLPSRLEAIAGVVAPATDSEWLERALRLPVRRLEEEARAARRSAVVSAGDGGDPPGGPPPGAAPRGDPPAASPDREPEAVPVEIEEPDTLVSFPCPGRIVGLWHWSLDLVRRVAGRQEPAWRCAEYLAAEFLSGVAAPAGPAPHEVAGRRGDDAGPCGARSGDGETGGVDASSVSAGSPPSRRGDAAPADDREFGGAGGSGSWDVGVWQEATSAVREALQRLGPAASPDGMLSGRLADPDAARSGSRVSPWRLDAALRALVRLRQSLAWRQGRLLSVLCRHDLHVELGHPSFADWCADVAGMSPRRARYLVSLDRRLCALPHLADAYRRGAISWCQARLLVRAARPGSERRWIRFARQVTVRRLEEAVVAAEIAVAEAVDGRLPGGVGPLPPDDAAARRHTSARSLPEAGGADATDWPVPEAGGGIPGTAPTGRHTSARASGRMGARIVFAAPAAVARLWAEAVVACRAAVGSHIAEWECLEIFVRSLRETWENPDDPDWRRRYRIFERDGWRCAVPGCTSRANLNEHHIVFRSRGGGDEEPNLVTLCVGHHQQGVHRGRVRCAGQAPDSVVWDLGARPDGPPLARYSGDRLLGSWRAL
jgi:hypothetical protein